ncbi:MAG: hypothetical protein NC337_05500 [Roseburia sp.]|nr:hypothetical protein [Roseburia sp.]
MSVDRIAKLTEQYDKEMALAEKHRKKAKSLADQIKYMKGEECNDRINRLNLTPDQFSELLRLLDNKTRLMTAVEMCLAQNAAGQNDGEDEREMQVPTEDGRETEAEIPDEVPVFGEGDEKVS